MNDAPSFASFPPLKSLPRDRQWTILGVAAILVLALFFGAPLIGACSRPSRRRRRPRRRPAHSQPPMNSGRRLGSPPLRIRASGPRSVTDGKIATDDDHTTQVFSPFSGRVTKVFAKAGDVVKAGQPLFAVQASEFVQAQSDLVAAVAQLKVATAADARQHELFKASGAALKDVQQADADLANAKAALAAVRGRTECSGHGRRPGLRARKRRRQGGRAVVSAPIGGVVTQKRDRRRPEHRQRDQRRRQSPAFVVSDLVRVWLVGDLREATRPRPRSARPAGGRAPSAAGPRIHS